MIEIKISETDELPTLKTLLKDKLNKSYFQNQSLKIKI